MPAAAKQMRQRASRHRHKRADGKLPGGVQSQPAGGSRSGAREHDGEQINRARHHLDGGHDERQNEPENRTGNEQCSFLRKRPETFAGTARRASRAVFGHSSTAADAVRPRFSRTYDSKSPQQKGRARRPPGRHAGAASSLKRRSREGYSPLERSRIASSPADAAKADIAAAKLACGGRRPRTGAARKKAHAESPAPETALSTVRVLAAACFFMKTLPALPERARFVWSCPFAFANNLHLSIMIVILILCVKTNVIRGSHLNAYSQD